MTTAGTATRQADVDDSHPADQQRGDHGIAYPLANDSTEPSLRSLFEHACIGIYRTSADGQLLLANPYLVKMLGFDSFEELQHYYHDQHGFIGAASRAAFIARIREAGGVLSGFESVWRTQDGSTIHISENSHSCYAADGTVLYYEGMVQDITERKAAVSDMQTARQELQRILETVPARIWQKNRNGVYKQANKQFCDDIGLAEQDILGKTDFDLYPKEMAERHVMYDQHLLQSGTSLVGNEEYYQKPGGEWCWRQINKVLYYDKDGKVAGTIGFSFDITERKQAEAAVQQLLTEKQLLLREVQHRIKNNMSTMVSLLRLQATAQGDPRTVRILQDAIGRLNAMMVLYDQLYRKAGQQHLDLNHYLSALVQQIMNIYPQSAGVRLNMCIEPLILEEKVLSPLGIIFNELISNAMKYAFNDHGDSSITITAARSGAGLVLAYHDNGPGFPEGLSFETVTSFGLQLVRIMVEQLDGKLRLERTSGTTIMIELPIGSS
jgi:PAS domain S-box-containing protein